MVAELFFWPALVAYGEASVALVGEARRPGWPGRAAIWGVRLGWLAQTGLLVVQAASWDGFAWSSRAAALNLFVWLVVGGYLIWGCRPRFRLLGLVVLPPAAVLLALSYLGGGMADRGEPLDALLALHVAAMLAALAGFTVSAALAALYLWHERRLKRHERTILRLPVPPLAALERLGRATAAASLAALGVGMALGVAALVRGGLALDAAMLATVAVAAA
ncbi:MAG: cytochrome c biogenesis protein CcsA, partial [Thermoleophilia bacterium]|nr:cytochrome c biogenesis protein CcsA [Thermoleophilia bacterium]